MSKIDMKTKLVNLLRVIFQFEDQDLDFGIYRIMNQKREDIRKFIDQELIDKINEQLQLIGEEEKKKKLQELQELKSRIIEAYTEDAFKDGELKDEFKDYPLARKYTEKLQELKTIEVTEDLERDTYNHIFSFFSRYYDKGDFVSKRRVGRKEKYAIPYSGQETLLHWTNKDQYYVKTTLQFKRYNFTANGLTVNFRVVQAEEEKGNLKADEDRYFVIHKEKPFELDGNVLNIYFEYRPLEDKEQEEHKFGKKTQISQKDVNQFNLDVLQHELGEKEKTKALFKKENDRTVLHKNLYKFTTSNKSDYFIHKNLKQFLTRELDFYIKNEVLSLEDMKQLGKENLDRHLLKAKVIHNISLKIAEFLSQLEDFQKMLWEKKKFVVQTDYCITLDRIPEKFYSEILANKKQIEEWKRLYRIDDWKKDLVWRGEIDEGFLKAYPFMMVDTAFFDEGFKLRLLAAYDNLDAQIDGILIHGENFQALNLLLEKYRERIKCMYIDPPYNTGKDEFLYKDNYQHSSWLTMMNNRLKLAHQLLEDDGAFFVSIDDNEVNRLNILLQDIFGEGNWAALLVTRTNPRGRTLERYIAKTNDYITAFVKENVPDAILETPKEGEKLKAYDKEDERGKYRELGLRNRNPIYTRKNRPNLFFPIYVNPTTGKVSLTKNDDFRIEVYPRNSRGADDCWTWSKEKVANNLDKLGARRASTGTWRVYRKDHLRDEEGNIATTMAKSIWLEKEINNERGKEVLTDVMGYLPIDFPKSVELIKKCVKIGCTKNGIVADFFAGSGTTAHSVLDLNREDGGHRRYLLVDVDDYLVNAMKSRIQKMVFASDWKDGVPQNRNGLSHILKFQRLEQYEDALESIQFEQRTVEDFRDYFVKYMLNFETRNSSTLLNIDSMQDPFNYKIKVIETLGRQPKLANVDLVETFNYLIGLEVDKIKAIEENGRKYLFVLGEVDDVRTLVVWRSLKDIDFEEDKKVIERIKKELSPDEVYVNGDAGIRDFKLIENEFKSLLWD